MNRVSFESLIFLTTLFVVFLLYIPAQSTAENINCRASVPDCFGTNRDDVISSSFESKIYAGKGDDVIINSGDYAQFIYGGEGDDMIFGGDGNDLIFGGFDNDRIDGGFGSDNIYGEEGNDNIAGSWGNDLIFGDHDEIQFRSTGSDKMFGGPGDDAIYANRGFAPTTRDFHRDYADCGSGSNDAALIRSSDGDIAEPNCEGIHNDDN